MAWTVRGLHAARQPDSDKEGSEADLEEDKNEKHGWWTIAPPAKRAKMLARLKALRRKHGLGEFRKARRTTVKALSRPRTRKKRPRVGSKRWTPLKPF